MVAPEKQVRAAGTVKCHFKSLSVLVAQNSMSPAQKFPAGLLVGLAQAVNVAVHSTGFGGGRFFRSLMMDSITLMFTV